VITLDSSGVIALLNRRDAHHEAAVEALRTERTPRIVPASILAEIAYMLESRGLWRLLDEFLETIENGHLVTDCGDEDVPRIRGLVARYADMPLGYADAATMACAERNGGRVLTFDYRHFGAVAREGTITLVPQRPHGRFRANTTTSTWRSPHRAPGD
jgi:predicted nucleic acid-binding protein